MDKKKAREDLLEQAASLATDIANLEKYRRGRQQARENLLEVVFRLQDGKQSVRMFPNVDLYADLL